MKYLVVVNQMYIVAVNANSALEAEHMILNNMDGIQGAQAFDQKSVRTETFAGYMMSCETVSFSELQQISRRYTEACEEMGKKLEEKKLAELEVERLKKLLEEAQHELTKKIQNHCFAKMDVEDAKKSLGMRDDR